MIQKWIIHVITLKYVIENEEYIIYNQTGTKFKTGPSVMLKYQFWNIRYKCIESIKIFNEL